MKTVKDQAIVILQDERAIWCRWQDKRLIDQRVIPHSENMVETELVPLDGVVEIVKRFNRPTVSLIIDSSLDEVGFFTGTGRDARMNASDTGHIHEALNRRCQLWLQAVQEQGLVFAQVTSTLRLLAGHSRKGKQQMLIVVDGDGLSRHVLCHRGRLAYARQCYKGDGLSSHEALIESLAYIDDSASPDVIGDCKIIYVGADQACLDTLNERAREPVIHAASINAEQWYFELFRRQRPRIGGQVLNRTLNHVLNGQLDRSESRRKLHRNDQKLYLATCLTVFIASITVIVACVHGFTVARYMRSVEDKSASLSNEISLAERSASAIHTQPIQAAESLARVALFDRIEHLDAAAVLTLVADAVTRHPGIQLDRLEWLMTDNDEALQWISVASLENAPVPTAIRQVLGRSLDATEAARIKVGTQIAIEGTVQELTLRGKQTVFEGFVNTLETSRNIASVEVLSSPLEHASSSELSESDFRFSLQIFHWPS